MKKKQYRGWPGDVPPKTAKEWDEPTDDALVEGFNWMVVNRGYEGMQFILQIRRHRESKRNNRAMIWLVGGTLGFTAISAVFVGLSVCQAI